jgi:transketolase
VCRTNIGHGSPNLVGQAKTHGAPLGGDEIAEMRAHLSWPHVPFELPDSIKNAWDLSKEGQDKMHEWMSKFDEYSVKYPDLSKELRRRKGAMLPDDWQERVAAWQVKLDPAGKDRATRQSSQDFLNHLAPHLPEIVGGSADLTPSNLTQWTAATVRSKQHPGGQYVHYGVREFGMAGIMNGLAVYGGFIPFGGTFLTFVDYMRNAVRLAAMMKQRVIYVLTHDSIGLGEDGPTHQPVEHIGMLRMTPNLHNWRPADALETAVAWPMAIEQRNGPTTLLLSRQKCPALDRCDVAGDKVEAIQRGGYCLRRHPKPDVLLMATGSEVSIICRAADTLQQRGVAAQVVSMPCVELFLEQPAEYQDEVLPPTVTRRVAMEAASSLPWYRFVGSAGHVLGLDHYGASAPAAELYEQFGFTAERVVDVVLQYRQQQSTVN